MFIERGFDLAVDNGYMVSMVTMEAWMFLPHMKICVINCLKLATINSMVHMPYLGKGRTLD